MFQLKPIQNFVLPIYHFRIDAPIVATHPHMLGAAPEYTNLIDGFEPDFRKHQILIDVEPVSNAHKKNK